MKYNNKNENIYKYIIINKIAKAIRKKLKKE